MTPDLGTTYLGMELPHPLVPSASPLGGRLDRLIELEDAGAAAVVLPSLFEEQIEHDVTEMQWLGELWAESFGEATGGYFPELEGYAAGPAAYLNHLAEAKKRLSIPVIGSLNGVSVGGWVRYAAQIEDNGADALELNIYFLAVDPEQTSEEVERRYIELIEEVRASIKIPLAVKVGPYFSAMANMASRIVDAGADGLVLFNRFYQPDIDLEEMQVAPTLALSTSDELRLPLQWIALLRPHTDASLAATTGVHTAEDVLKLIAVGADVTMQASVLLRSGPRHLTDLLVSVESWLVDHDYSSIRQLKGSLSRPHAPDPGAFERTNYMKVLNSYTGTRL